MIQIITTGVFIYVGSLMVFTRMRQRAGILHQGGFTTSYLALDDTPTNQCAGNMLRTA